MDALDIVSLLTRRKHSSGSIVSMILVVCKRQLVRIKRKH